VCNASTVAKKYLLEQLLAGVLILAVRGYNERACPLRKQLPTAQYLLLIVARQVANELLASAISVFSRRGNRNRTTEKDKSVRKRVERDICLSRHCPALSKQQHSSIPTTQYRKGVLPHILIAPKPPAQTSNRSTRSIAMHIHKKKKSRTRM
jgi:hypothetical protein